jgi:twinkle protein
MASLTSVEKTAIQLDEFRKTRLKEAPVDFDAYMKSREEDNALVKPAEDFRDALHEEFYGADDTKGLLLPWHKLWDKWRIRHGELTVWSGFNGHMKSILTGYVLLDLMRQGEKACVLSFEMKPRKTLRRMAKQSVGVEKPSQTYIDKFLDSVSGKLWLYDQQGETTPERVYAVITYCAEQLGCRQFVVDSMMKVVRDEDDYNGQKRFAGKLYSLSRDLNVHIHLVTHSRKREDENKRPGKQDNKGSGSIVDQTDNFAVVFKIPKKPDVVDDGPDFCLYLDKQRDGEFEGNLALWLDPASLQFKEGRFDKVRQFV